MSETVYTGDVWRASYAVRRTGNGTFRGMVARNYASDSWGVTIFSPRIDESAGTVELSFSFPIDGRARGIYTTDEADGIVRDIIHSAYPDPVELSLRTMFLVSRVWAPKTPNESKGYLPSPKEAAQISGKAIGEMIAAAVESAIAAARSAAKGAGNSLGIGEAGAWIGAGLAVAAFLYYKSRD